MAAKKYPGNEEGVKKLQDLIAAGKPTAKNTTVRVLNTFPFIIECASQWAKSPKKQSERVYFC